jgi:hypothetical protein
MKQLVAQTKAFPAAPAYTYCPMGLVMHYMGEDLYKRPGEESVLSVILPDSLDPAYPEKHDRLCDSVGRFMTQYDMGELDRDGIASAFGVKATVDEAYPR